MVITPRGRASAVRRHAAQRPPGSLVAATAAVAALVTLDAATIPTFANLAVMVILWMGVATAWLSGSPGSAWQARALLSGPDRLRWLAVPILVLLTILAAQSGVATRARFELSRGPLDRLAAAIAAGRETFPDRVGLYQVTRVQGSARHVRVDIEGLGLYEGNLFLSSRAFVWLEDRTVSATELDADCDCHHEALGGGWWAVTGEY